MVNNQLTVTFGVVAVRSYFGGRLVGQQLGANIYEPVIQDRLGSVGKYYPYGEERNSPQLPNDQVKFATYTRDSATGNDYADQRYYTSTLGRFMTVDPGNAGAINNPQSLNRYTYVIGDPVNSFDPEGLCTIFGGGITQSAFNNSNLLQEFASELGGISVFPYANGSLPGGGANVFLQGTTGIPTGAVGNWLDAIALAAETPGPISIYAFSGSAAAFTTAYNLLPTAIQARINNITYIDPGNVTTPLASGMPGTNVTVYTDSSDIANVIVNLFGAGPSGPVTIVPTGTCGHNLNCVITRFTDQLSSGATGCDVGSGSVFGLPKRTYTYLSGHSIDLSWLIDSPPVPSVTSTITYYPVPSVTSTINYYPE